MSEDEQQCPWCGREPGSILREEAGPGLSVPTMAIVIALMVVATGFLVVNLHEDSLYVDTRLEFSSPELTNRTVDEQVLWTVTVVTLKVTPEDEPVPISELRVKVLGPDGTVLQKQIRVRPFDVSKLYDGSDGSRTVQAWYVNEDGDKDNIGDPDLIRVSGLSDAFERGVVRLMIDGRTIGTVELPASFPD